MKLVLFCVAVVAMLAVVPAASASDTPSETAALCSGLFGSTFDAPSAEPLAPCQWDMSLIGASAAKAWSSATGKGVTVGVIDSGADVTHPDVAPNLDLARSCSFIFSTTPTALPQEVGNGDCANKAAVQDVNGHGTHVASEIAAHLVTLPMEQTHDGDLDAALGELVAARLLLHEDGRYLSLAVAAGLIAVGIALSLLLPPRPRADDQAAG